MSLPLPTTSSSSKTTTTSNSDFDRESERLYIELVQRSRGDLRHLLTSFFSFLHRRTDLYCIMDSTSASSIAVDATTSTSRNNMGFKEGEAEKIIIAAFRQFPLRRIPSATTSTLQQQQPQSKSSSLSSHTTPLTTTVSSTTASSKTATTSITATEKMNDHRSDSKPKPGRTTTKNDNDTENIQYTEDGLQIPIGNGGITSKYRWTQTLEECTVLVQCPKGNQTTTLRGKDLRVTILPNTLRVQILQHNNNEDGKPNAAVPESSSPSEECMLLNGELSQRIVPSESTWTMESGVLQIILYKHVPTFWDSIFLNDTIKIDASLVDSRRNIDTYDAITQAHIRKIIFEQQQQSQGLPPSEDTIITSSGDGVKSTTIPAVLPQGVEYIDQEILVAKMKELGK